MSSNRNMRGGGRIGLMAAAIGIASIAIAGYCGASIITESSAGRLASGSKIAVAKIVVEATTALSAAWLDRLRLALGYQLVRRPSNGFVAAMAGAGEGLRLFRWVAARATSDVSLRKEANYLALGVLNRMPLDEELRAVAGHHADALGKALQTTDFDRAEKAAVFEEVALHAARSGAEPLAISLAEQADASEPPDPSGQWSSRVRSVRVALALCAANSPRPFAREAKPFAAEIGADYLRKNFVLAWDAGLVMTVLQADASAQCKQLARDYARVARSTTTTSRSV